MKDIIEQLGQMFLVGFDGLSVEPDHWVVQAIKQDNLGGVILFDRNIDGSTQNIQSPEQLIGLTDTLQGYADIPLFIAVDQEGGKVCRLKERDGFPASVSADRLVNHLSFPEALEQMGKIAASLAVHGINMNLAPVVDLAINPDNPIISRYERSFGADVDKVVQFAEHFVAAHHKKGVGCCLKHFPGHGSSRGDSHLGFVDITEDWREEELEPYSRLINSGFTDAVMTAHVLHRKLEPAEMPATLSKFILTDLLRKKLGFKGVIITDDLQMKAIRNHWSLEEAVGLSVMAGVDVLIVGNNLVREEDVVSRGVNAIKQLLFSGKIEEQRIRDSLDRILTLKKKIIGERKCKGNRH